MLQCRRDPRRNPSKIKFVIITLLLVLLLEPLYSHAQNGETELPQEVYVKLHVSTASLTIEIPALEEQEGANIRDLCLLVVNNNSAPYEYCLDTHFTIVERINLPKCYHLHDVTIDLSDNPPPGCETSYTSFVGLLETNIFWTSSSGSPVPAIYISHRGENLQGDQCSTSNTLYTCERSYSIPTPTPTPTNSPFPTLTQTSTSSPTPILPPPSTNTPTAIPTSTSTLTPITFDPMPFVPNPPNPSSPNVIQVNGYEMVFIPPGQVYIDLDGSNIFTSVNGFYMDRYEYSDEPNVGLPRIGITQEEAQTICLSRNHNGRDGSLPSFGQWLYAASGAENRVYVWDDESSGRLLFINQVNFTNVNNMQPFDDITWSGVYHMTGNASEWTSDLDGNGYIVAGGNIDNDSLFDLRTTRTRSDARSNIGFRCVIEVS